MRLRMVGHASLLIEASGVRLLTDPWLVGQAFANGWCQRPKPLWCPDDIDCTHLWISHEHPDHFSPATLRAIPADRRRTIDVLVQRALTADMAEFLTGLGWRSVTELDHRGIHRLAPDLTVQLHQFGLIDSSLTIDDTMGVVVVLNDCKPTGAGLARLRRDVGAVSVLCDQYSIAAWAGNPGDTGRFARRQQLVLDHLAAHVEALAPDRVVPYASSVRFCQPDNAHMNEAIVGADLVADRIIGPPLVWLEPGDYWIVGATGARPAGRSTKAAMPAPRSDTPTNLAAARSPAAGTKSAPGPDIVELARLRLDELIDRTPQLLRRRLSPLGFEPVDGAFAPFVFDPDAGVVVVGADELARAATCRLGLTGDSARSAFTHRWGLETLSISGRFRLDGDELVFQRWKQLAAGVSAGFVTRQPAVWLTDSRRRRFLRKRGPEFALELATKLR